MDLFEPKSIAVIGASADKGSVGHDILQNLLTQGYEGEVFPINPKHKELQGKQAYASVLDIESEIDLAMIIVPAKIVPTVLKECGEKSITNVVIVSAGFGEIHTDEGDQLEKEVQSIAKQYDINVVGPNCLGIVRPSAKLNASFAAKLPPQGGVALISQSGATAVAVMDASASLGIGYSLVASIGNKTVLDESDFLELAAQDKETKVIGLYLENIKDGRRFLKTAMQCNKPIVLLKAGVSQQGSKAASSHTGALAGSDAGIQALCKQSGIVRAHTSEEFLDLLEGLSTQPKLASNNIAIVTNAGGPGILATDAAELAGLTLPKLEEKIEKKLREQLPEAASTGNPIDVIGDAGTDRYEAALAAVGSSASIDGVALLLTPQVMTPVEDIAQTVINWKEKYPTMPLVTCFMGEENVKQERLTIQQAGIPSYETPERALKVLGALKPMVYCSAFTEEKNDVRAATAADIIGSETGLLSDATAQKLCDLYGISMVHGTLATSVKDAIAIAGEAGYPVIAKVVSKDIVHKTDVGGIRAELINADEVIEAWESINRNVKTLAPDATVDGILIQKMMEPGDEFIVGTVRDASFGPLVMVGLGGLYTELLQDTSFRIAPVNTEEAYHMLTDLHAWKVLLGARGKQQLDIDHLATLVEHVSQLAIECPQISDIDLNPVFVREKQVTAADVKIVVG